MTPLARSAPHDFDAESAVIGCCLASNDAARWVSEWLRPADFYGPKNQAAVSAIIALFAEGKRADAVTVADCAKRQGWMEPLTADLISALSNAPAVSAIERYGHIVRRHSVARTAMTLAWAAQDDLGNQVKDPDEIVDELIADLRSIDSHVPSGQPLGFMTFEELIAKPPEQRSPWILRGMLRRDWRATFVGPEGAGKSLLLRELAVCAAAGMRPFVGGDVTQEPVRTLLVDLENPEDHLLDWVDRLCRHATQWHRETDGRGAVWHRPGGVDLRKRSDRGQFEEVLRRHKPELVCLGPLYKSFRRHSTRETDEEAAGQMQEILDDLRTRYGFALVLEHHAPKGQGGVRDLVPFGSSLWMRWGELRMSLSPPDKTFPVWKMTLTPYSGSRVEHNWPDWLERNKQSSGLPWIGHWEEPV
jgi:replicative DNA helicase